MKLSQLKSNVWTPQHTLIFGDAKTGKTELVGKLAEKYNLHWFDLENGHRTLLKLPLEWQERINIYKVPDSRSYPIAIETMRKVTTGAPVNLCIKHAKHDCQLCKKDGSPFHDRFCLHELGENDIFVVDGGTQLGNSAINHIIRNENEDYKPGWEDYRKQGTLLDGFYSNIQQGHYNCVVICHTTTARMEDSEKSKLVPVSGTDNFSRNLAKYFDHVIYCDVGLGKHNFGSSTTYRLQVLTGSRTDLAIEKFADPKLLPFYTGETPKLAADPVADALKSLKGSAAKAAELAAVEKK